jgi:hypothetical protein
MIILAIDPGDVMSGVCRVSHTQGQEFPEILSADKIANHKLLSAITNLLAQAGYSDLNPTSEETHCVCIEKIAGSYGKHGVGLTVMETVWWSGRFYQEARGHAYRYARQTVRAAMGAMSGGDELVKTKLKQIYGDPGTKKNPGPTYALFQDSWQALALAVTHIKKTRELKEKEKKEWEKQRKNSVQSQLL